MKHLCYATLILTALSVWFVQGVLLASHGEPLPLLLGVGILVAGFVLVGCHEFSVAQSSRIGWIMGLLLGLLTIYAGVRHPEGGLWVEIFGAAFAGVSVWRYLKAPEEHGYA